MATALAEAGADVACHGNTREPGPVAALVEQAGRRALALTGDLADRSVPHRRIEQTLLGLGKLDILTNNAGMIPRQPALEYSEENSG